MNGIYCLSPHCGRRLDADDKQCPHGVWTCQDHDMADGCDECLAEAIEQGADQ